MWAFEALRGSLKHSGVGLFRLVSFVAEAQLLWLGLAKLQYKQLWSGSQNDISASL